MATLSVLKFNDPYGADRVLVALQGMQERQMITLENAAVVSWPQGNRKPKTRQLHSTAGAGAGWGAFWGFLFGLIFFVPFLGAAIGADMGGMSGALADVGIDDDFIREVREKVTEGTSALGLALVIFAIPVLAIIGLYAAVPHRGSVMLGSLQTWMGNYNRQITLVMCLGFGAFFLVRGLWGALQWRLWRRQVRAAETSI
jgi:uncharacterized membrane protein